MKKQKKLLKKLRKIGPVLEGSLNRVKRICGNPNCRCRKYSKYKHPATYLTWKEENKTKALYIPVSMNENAKQWNDNYKKMRALMKKISELQKKIIKTK